MDFFPTKMLHWSPTADSRFHHFSVYIPLTNGKTGAFQLQKTSLFVLFFGSSQFVKQLPLGLKKTTSPPPRFMTGARRKDLTQKKAMHENPAILLMVQKSQTTTWDVKKPCKYWGKLPTSTHQQYHYLTASDETCCARPSRTLPSPRASWKNMSPVDLWWRGRRRYIPKNSTLKYSDICFG